MTDLEKVELAARRTGSDILASVWIDERERQFLANAFLAFADTIAQIIKDHVGEP